MRKLGLGLIVVMLALAAAKAARAAGDEERSILGELKVKAGIKVTHDGNLIVLETGPLVDGQFMGDVSSFVDTMDEVADRSISATTASKRLDDIQGRIETIMGDPKYVEKLIREGY